MNGKLNEKKQIVLYVVMVLMLIFLLINIALWTIYFFVIWDFSSGIAQVVMGMICVISLYRISARRVSHT